MGYKAENKVESRSEHKKLKNNVNGSSNNRYLSLLLSIAGILVIGATAIFYVYPKIMSEGDIQPKKVTKETVSSIDVKKETVSEKTNEVKSKKVTKDATTKDTATKETKNTDEKKQSTEYVLPDSNSRKLTNADLSKLSSNDLRIARNEIYARHGLVFKSSDLTIYFTSKSWYSPNPAYNGALNEVETYNLNLIKSME